MGHFLRIIVKPVTALAGDGDHSLERQIALSLARHALTALGGILLAHGWIDANGVQDVVGGSLAILGALAGGVQKAAAQP